MTTTIFPASQGPPTLPGLKIDQATPKPSSSSQPTTSGSQSASSGKQRASSGGNQFTGTLSNQALRVMTQQEWVQFCRGVGVFKDDESETVIRPNCWYWPPKGFPDGLYQDVLYEKTKFSYYFHMLSFAQWLLMILQLAMSAVLTALGSLPSKDGTAITSIAGVNTLISGLLALMHNSGLPDRFRSDRNEFYKVEEYLKEIIDTRLVPAENNIMEAMADCFNKFQDARQTVEDNIPASYTPSAPNTATPLRTQQPAPAK